VRQKNTGLLVAILYGFLCRLLLEKASTQGTFLSATGYKPLASCFLPFVSLPELPSACRVSLKIIYLCKL